MVRSLGVETSKPTQQSMIELGQIIEEQLFMNVEELFLDGAVEALAVSVHLGGTWKGVPVLDTAGR
jgi:hypothetical protein